MKGYITQATAVCGGCAHFHQHYIRFGEEYHPISYGHCVYPARKRRRVEETCDFWMAREEEKTPE